jgi:hypothetical protein
VPKLKEGTVEEPGIRIYLKEGEFKQLVDFLEGHDWDSTVRWRLRTKWSEHINRADGTVLNGEPRDLPKRTGAPAGPAKRTAAKKVAGPVGKRPGTMRG